ncbi:titin homolog isoform X3 [Takifugu flavidus]|uniref:titin homolog isoform X3 n=1 Tax=Takifugu flavidus TaxID=433684 RepID=UPI002544436F|nr:titin homolog isoform X3 [Takifugu flavidus]
MSAKMEACQVKPQVKKKGQLPKPPPKPVKELKASPRYSESRSVEAENSKEKLSVMSELSTSKDSLSGHNQDKVGLFGRMFRKSPKPPENNQTNEDQCSLHDNMSGSTDSLSENSKLHRQLSPDSKMGEMESEEEKLSVKSELSTSKDSLSEHNQDKVGLFGRMFRKSPKPPENNQTNEDQRSLHDNMSGSSDSLSENSKGKGLFFGGLLRKTPKEGIPVQEYEDNEISSESLTKNSIKEKSIFGGMLKKTPKPAETTSSDEELVQEVKTENKLTGSSETLSNANVSKEKGGSLFSGLLKKTPKPSEKTSDFANREALRELSASNEDLTASEDDLSEKSNTKDKNIFSNIFKKPQKQTLDAAAGKELEVKSENELSGSNEKLSDATVSKEKGGSLFSGLLKKTPKPSEKTSDFANREALRELSASNEDLTASDDDLSEKSNTKDKNIFSNIFKKPQKKALDAAAGKELEVKSENELSGSNEKLSDATVSKEKGGSLFSGLLKKTPKPSEKTSDFANREALRELSASNEDLTASDDDLSEKSNTKDKNIFSNIFKKPQKKALDSAAGKELEVKTENELSCSSEKLWDANVSKEREGQRVLSASNDDLMASDENTTKHKNIFSNMFKTPQKQVWDAAAGKLEVKTANELSGSNEKLSDANAPKEKRGGLAGIFIRSSSIDNLLEEEKSVFSGMFKKSHKPSKEATSDEESNTGKEKSMSASCESLSEATVLKEKTVGLVGYFKKSPKPAPRTIVTKDPLSEMEVHSSSDSLTETAEESVNLERLEQGRLSRSRTIKKKKRVVSFRLKKTLYRVPKADQISEKIPLIEEAVELQELTQATSKTESTVEVQPIEMASYPSEDNPMESEEEGDELMQWWNTVKGWAEWNETNNFPDNEEMALEQAADRVYMAACLFVRLFNQRGASLQHRILELLALADAADQFHKKTVTAAVGGGVASVAGSIATITGLILAPFTFGASIIVTAVGISVATAGSITSATANITDAVHSNMDRKKLEKMIQDYQDEINVIRECLEFVQAGMDTLQEWDFDKYSQSAAKKALNHNIKHVMKEGGRAGKALMINTDKLISTVQILGTAGGAAKAVQAISVTTGVMSALFLALDVFFLAKDSHELRKGAKTKFANKIRDVCKELQDGLLELNKVKTQLQKTMDGIEVEEYEEIHEVEVEVDDDLASDPKKLAELEQELDLLEEKLNKKTEEDEKKYNEMKKDKGNTAKGTKTGEDKDKVDDQDGNKETLKTKHNKEKKLDSKFEITDEKNEQKIEKVNLAKVEVVKDKSPRESKTDKETENSVTAEKKKQGSRNDTNKEKEKIKTKEHDKYAQYESKQEQHGRAHLKRESERSKSRRDAERESHTKKEVDHGRKVERRAMDGRAEMSKKSEETENSGTQREDDFRKKSHLSQMRRDHPDHESTNHREEYKRHHTRTAVAREESMEARVRGGNGSIRKHSGSTQDKEKVEQRKSRDGERDKEGRRSHRGSRGRSSILEDGLYI